MKKLIVSLVASLGAGAIGTLFTMDAIPTWYATLEKPALNPPNWIFGPVWTVLYILMGIAAYLVWNTGLDKKEVKVALSFWLVQLVLNTLWSIIFFGMQNTGAALIEIIVLWLAILITIIAFSKISKAAAWLLVPYIAWVSFATYLTYSIWRLN